MNSKNLAVLEPYCENDMKRLKRISRSIFMKLNESLSNADYDDFYSVANLVLCKHEIIRIYESSIIFDTIAPNQGIAYE